MSKYFHAFCIVLGAIISMPSFAKDFHLYVRNDTKETITLVKEDGSRLSLSPRGYIQKERFKELSVVDNYIKEKKVCSWYISKSEACFKVVGLSYASDSHGTIGCNLEMIQKFPCDP